MWMELKLKKKLFLLWKQNKNESKLSITLSLVHLEIRLFLAFFPRSCKNFPFFPVEIQFHSWNVSLVAMMWKRNATHSRWIFCKQIDSLLALNRMKERKKNLCEYRASLTLFYSCDIWFECGEIESKCVLYVVRSHGETTDQSKTAL